MLQKLKNATSSWIFKILFVLLLASFSLWGIGGFLRSPDLRETDVAKVGAVEIPAILLDQAYRQNLATLRRTLGDSFDEKKLQGLDLWGASLDRLVRTTLMRLAAQDAGLQIDDVKIAQKIAQDPTFKNAAGRFDPQQYHAILQASGLTEQQFADMLRQNLTLDALLGFISPNSLLPAGYAADLAKAQGQTRSVDVVYLPLMAIKNDATPSAEDLEEFHAAHAGRYTKPEQRAVSYVEVSASILATGITVSDEDLKQAYEKNKADFYQPEKRDIAQVLLPDQAAAEAFAVKAKSPGADFKKTAVSSKSPLSALEKITQDTLPEELAAPFFSQTVGSVGGPVQSSLGWHVFQVARVYPAETQPFDQVKGQLLQDIKKTRAEDRVYSIHKEIQDALAAGKTFAAVAKEKNLPFTSVEGITQANPPAALADKPQLLTAAFQTAEGNVSDMVQEKDGRMYLVAVDKVMLATLKPLETIRAQVTEDWRRAERQKTLASQGQRLVETLAHADAAKIAAVIGATSETFFKLGRGDTPPAHVSPDLMAQMFQRSPGEVVSSIDDKGLTAVRIHRVNLPQTLDAKLLDKINQEQKQSVTNDLLVQFEQALRLRYPVTVYPEVLEQLKQR